MCVGGGEGDSGEGEGVCRWIVCLCVCMSEREREKSENINGVYVDVCVCENVCVWMDRGMGSYRESECSREREYEGKGVARSIKEVANN